MVVEGECGGPGGTGDIGLADACLGFGESGGPVAAWVSDLGGALEVGGCWVGTGLGAGVRMAVGSGELGVVGGGLVGSGSGVGGGWCGALDVSLQDGAGVGAGGWVAG